MYDKIHYKLKKKKEYKKKNDEFRYSQFWAWSVIDSWILISYIFLLLFLLPLQLWEKKEVNLFLSWKSSGLFYRDE